MMNISQNFLVLVADSEEDRHNKLILDDESIDNLINNKDVMHTLTFKSHPSKVLGYYPKTYIHYSNRKGKIRARYSGKVVF